MTPGYRMILVNDIVISDGGVAWFSTGIDIMMVALSHRTGRSRNRGGWGLGW